MDTAQWPQGIGLVKPMDHHHHQHEDQISTNTCNRPIGGERRATRPQEQLNCPRCNSTNTKFCYYNNYSLTQPRYFCKGCRRYWTEGGSLRNVPVGGGSRKNKRSTTNTSSSSSPTTSSFKLPDLNPPRSSLSSSMLHLHHQNPSHQGQDLNLSFQEHHQHGSFLQPPKMENRDQESNQITQNPNSSASNCSSSALDLLRTGIAGRGLSSFVPIPMPDSNTIYSSNGGFTLQEFKPASLSFPVGGHENGGRLFFPFGDFSKQVSESDQQKGQATNKYWNNGMPGNGGGSW